MTDQLQVGVSMGLDFAGLDPKAKRDRLEQWANAGATHTLIADHVSFRGGHGTDALLYLSHVGGLTDRLGLYAGVMLLALRHPTVAARQIATVAGLMPGRLTVGVGVGGEDRHEFEACGVDPSTRGRRTDAALEIVRALLDGQTVTRSDPFFDLDEVLVLPAPDPPVPLTIGGRSDAALRRAGRYGDGWLASWCSVDRFTAAVEIIDQHAGSRSVDWRHGIQLWVGVGDDRQQGRRWVSETMERFYRMPFDPFEKYTPVGTAEDLAEFLAPYVSAGATTLNLTPCGPDRETELAVISETIGLLADVERSG